MLCGVWISCAAAVGLSMQWHLAGVNLWTLAPNQVLLWSIDFAAPSAQSIPARDELVRRILSNAAPDAAQQALLQSILSRHPEGGEPGTVAWRKKWERPVRAWLATVTASDASRDALLRIPVEWNASVALYPMHGEPLSVTYSLEDFWPETIEGRLEIHSPMGESYCVLFDPSGYQDARSGFQCAMPAAIDAASSAMLDMHFTVHTAWRTKSTGKDPPSEWNELEAQTIALPLAPMQAKDALLVPFESDSLTQAVASAFSDGLVRWTEPPSRVGLRFDVGATAGSEFRDTLIGVRATVRHGETVVRTSHLWWCAQEGSTVGWSMSVEDSAALARAPEGQPDRWTLTIEGDASVASFLLSQALREGALRPSLPFHYFSGRVEIPLTITDYNSPAPPRRFRPES